MPEPSLTLHAADGHALAATAFEPTEAPRAVLLIAPAMAVPQNYYAPFARWLAETQGIAVLTFDYRGIGASRRGPLAAVRADVLTWARQDCAAALAEAARRWPTAPLHWLGHSLGAQIVGLVPGHERLAGMLSVAAGSGYWHHTRPRVRALSPWLWWVLVPLALKAFGYFPGGRLRKIGDLPGGVMAQWRRWCLDPDYLGGESAAVRAELAAAVLPITALAVTDDELMTERGVRALFGLYRAARVEIRRLEPRAHGLAAIGHFGFFRERMRETLWPMVPRWIEQTSA
ncbi:MAG TPA: alpha/beta hydrolase [Methylibium sp.]|nr:alpha/beta hydrolase [Methylibium sp.]